MHPAKTPESQFSEPATPKHPTPCSRPEAKEGDAVGSRPGITQPKSRAKFDAWSKLKGAGAVIGSHEGYCAQQSERTHVMASAPGCHDPLAPRFAGGGVATGDIRASDVLTWAAVFPLAM